MRKDREVDRVGFETHDARQIGIAARRPDRASEIAETERGVQRGDQEPARRDNEDVKRGEGHAFDMERPHVDERDRTAERRPRQRDQIDAGDGEAERRYEDRQQRQCARGVRERPVDPALDGDAEDGGRDQPGKRREQQGQVSGGLEHRGYVGRKRECQRERIVKSAGNTEDEAEAGTNSA